MTKSDRPAPPAGGPSREERLAKALRENLKRRKAAPAPADRSKPEDRD